ncbi:MAG: hypothetical protein HQM16_08700 [Deltaproteobacteria bacterium]|nr:hypothetical protein [Deltaproteobacteria bacterium]
MILVSIGIVYLVGLAVLFLAGQHRHVNIFEGVALAFGVGVSLVVFGLVCEGVFFDRLSMVPTVIMMVVLALLFLLRRIKDPLFFRQILSAVSADLSKVKQGFLEQKKWQRLLVICCFVYVLTKLVMAVMINVSHPTISEDAVNGWDLKTKVFFENKSLVLDAANPEFSGGAPVRNNYAPLADLFFILFYREFPVGLSNILSPLIYINFCLLFFGFFLRRCTIRYACLSVYIFLSLPLMFIHSFTSYFNLPTAFYLFAFSLYLSDQILNPEKKRNVLLILPLTIFLFFGSGVRSENVYLVILILGIEVFVLLLSDRLKNTLGTALLSLLLLVAPLCVILFNDYFKHLDTAMAGHLGEMGGAMFALAFNNIFEPGLLVAPFEQALFHPDYNILFLVFCVAVILMFVFHRANREVFTQLLVMTGVFLVVILTLYAYPGLLGLLTHFGMRYYMVVVPFAVYIVVMVVYNMTTAQGT